MPLVNIKMSLLSLISFLRSLLMLRPWMHPAALTALPGRARRSPTTPAPPPATLAAASPRAAAPVALATPRSPSSTRPAPGRSTLRHRQHEPSWDGPNTHARAGCAEVARVQQRRHWPTISLGFASTPQARTPSLCPPRHGHSLYEREMRRKKR